MKDKESIFIGTLKMLKCEQITDRKNNYYECMFEVENEYGSGLSGVVDIFTKEEYARIKKIKIGDEVILKGYPEGIAKGDYVGLGEFAKRDMPYDVWESLDKVVDDDKDCKEEL